MGHALAFVSYSKLGITNDVRPNANLLDEGIVEIFQLRSLSCDATGCEHAAANAIDLQHRAVPHEDEAARRLRATVPARPRAAPQPPERPMAGASPLQRCRSACLLSRAHGNTVVVALASKLVRIAWALLRKETAFAAGRLAAA
jgi:hypothetical protein